MRRRAQSATLAAAALAAPLLAGCEGVQSALDPAGIQAGRIAGLWWGNLWVLGAIYALVIVMLAGALLLPRRRGQAPPPEGFPREPRIERRLSLGLGVLIAGTVAIILGLTAASYGVDRHLADLEPQAGMRIEVTAHQWWWEVTYDDPQPSRSFTTANEIYLPQGVPVRVTLTSNDVIHSFWIPNLHGKTDLIPGRVNETFLRGDRIGRYRGQCAEFCGFQHAHMALDVQVVTPEAFAAWREARLAPSRAPVTDEEKQGLQVFLSSPCVMCHQIRGTTAASHVGPDLTHVAGRSSIGAGTLPYNRGNLAGWVVDAQRIKPGIQMPTILMHPTQLQPLLAYLDSLT